MQAGQFIWMGAVPYALALEHQRKIHALRVEQAIPDTLLLLEHPPVITLGKGWHSENLLMTEAEYAQRGIEVFATDRGGDVTYHAPGQLVGYPIFSLWDKGRDLHRYLRLVEESLILALGDWGIEAGRLPPHTGVWVGDEKVAAMGIKASRWVTMHGFALNVNNDLCPFEWIIPCGILEKGVASVQSLTQRAVSVEAMIPGVVAGFERAFGIRFEQVENHSY